MTARIFAFVLWAALAAAVAFWGLKLGSHADRPPAHAAPVTGTGVAQGDLGRLFGAGAPSGVPVSAAPATSESARFKLLGTFASRGRESEAGWATVTIDNGPPRTVAVGASLPGTDLVLQQVGLRHARMGPEGGAATVSLELPVLPAAATGRLPAAANGMNAPAGNAPMSGGVPTPGLPGTRAMAPVIPQPAPVSPPTMAPPGAVPTLGAPGAVPPVPATTPLPGGQMIQRNEAPPEGAVVPQN